ncbi:MAG: hypothetical protein R6U37_07355 [Dehalococcoidia bacterium]
MKKLIPLILVVLIAALTFGCGDEDGEDGSFTPIELVPQQSNMLAYVDLSRILDEVDVAGFYERIPKEPDAPATFEKALDMLGIEELDEAILFGDISSFTEAANLMGDSSGYIGFIVTGIFNEEQLIDTIESKSEAGITTTDYKGYTIYSDDSQDMHISFPGENTMVMSTKEPIRDIIDVREGNQSGVKGDILQSYNELGSGLFKVAIVIPKELMGKMTEEMNQDNEMGINPVAFFEGMESIGLMVDKEGDSVPIDARICFTAEEEAENMKGMLAFVMGMMDFDEMEVPEEGGAVMGLLEGMEVGLDGSCVEIGLEITSEMIEDMAESFQEGFDGFGLVGASEEENGGMTELHNVELAVASLMADPDMPVRNLETDERILDFAGTESEATADMANGGLITVAEESDVLPLTEYLDVEWTRYLYWVEPDGRVHQVPE